MTVEDVLIGSSNVIVKTNEENYEFFKSDSEVHAIKDELPDEVVESLEEEGFTIVSPFPKTVNHYVHDEGTPHDINQIAEELGIDPENPMAKEIANIGYEIELTIRVNGQGDWEVTHVLGQELKEPYSY